MIAGASTLQRAFPHGLVRLRRPGSLKLQIGARRLRASESTGSPVIRHGPVLQNMGQLVLVQIWLCSLIADNDSCTVDVTQGRSCVA